MSYRLGEVILSRETISRRVKEMAAEIANDNGRDKGIVVVGTGRGYIVALDENSGNFLWRFETGGGNISGKPGP